MSSRVSVKRRSNFSTIPNSLIRNKELSTDARVLIAYVMSCSDDWTFYVSELQKILRCGKDKWQKTRKEAIDAGYLKITPKNGPDGRLDGYVWEVFDEPLKQDVVAGSGHTPQDAVAEQNPREPENPATGEKTHREPEKTARRSNPPAGKSGPLRNNNQQKEKPKSCAADAPHDDLNFDLIFSACPRQGSWEATEAAVLAEVEAGATPTELLAAAKAYAAEQAGNEARFIKLSENFFAEKVWKRFRSEVAATVDESEILQRRADDILGCKPWARLMRPSEYGPCLVAGLVTEAQCAAAGIVL